MALGSTGGAVSPGLGAASTLVCFQAVVAGLPVLVVSGSLAAVIVLGVGSVAASLRTLSEPVASLSSVPSSLLLFSWRWLHPGGGTIGSTWLSMVVPCASMPWGCGSSCPVGHVQPWCHGAPVWSTASLSFSVGVGATLGVSLKDPFPSVVPGPRVAPALVNDPDVVGGVHKGAGVESVWSVSSLVSSFVVADRVPGGVGSLWLDAVCFLGGLPCTSL